MAKRKAQFFLLVGALIGFGGTFLVEEFTRIRAEQAEAHYRQVCRDYYKGLHMIIEGSWGGSSGTMISTSPSISNFQISDNYINGDLETPTKDLRQIISGQETSYALTLSKTEADYVQVTIFYHSDLGLDSPPLLLSETEVDPVVLGAAMEIGPWRFRGHFLDVAWLDIRLLKSVYEKRIGSNGTVMEGKK